MPVPLHSKEKRFGEEGWWQIVMLQLHHLIDGGEIHTHTEKQGQCWSLKQCMKVNLAAAGADSAAGGGGEDMQKRENRNFFVESWISDVFLPIPFITKAQEQYVYPLLTLQKSLPAFTSPSLCLQKIVHTCITNAAHTPATQENLLFPGGKCILEQGSPKYIPGATSGLP